MLLYIIPFPFFLFFPRLIYESRLLRHLKLKPIYDVLWEPFEPHLRCWLSLQLLFTTIAFVLQYFITSPANIIAILMLLIVGLVAQLVLKPYKSVGVNTFNSFLLLDLIVIFVFALFYNIPIVQTEVGNVESQDIVTLVLVLLAYISIVALLVYHMYHRFSWCRSLVASIRERFRNVVGREISNQKTNNREDGVKYSILREPFLADRDGNTMSIDDS